MKDLSENTLASIVAANHQAVSVLEKYNLDFCCRGKTTLAEACKEKNLTLQRVSDELKSILQAETGKTMPFTEMSATQLVNHIETRHHFYVKQAMPLIYMHLEKVANKHGERYPYMQEVFRLFGIVQDEMMSHMKKEETVLFPRIKEMEQKLLLDDVSEIQPGYIEGPISVMEKEHEQAGDILYRIRELTHHYAIPQGACTTFKVVLAELKDFEDDLHEHVHLENNILFPMSLRFAQ